MKKKLKKITIGTISVLLLLLVVLAIHIYIVTRPKAPDAYTKVMARIDIKQPITQEDATKITAWLYQQKGVDHVLVNPQSDIAVFTFYPVKTSADKIISDFKTTCSYQAQRYIPTEADVAGGCPVASTSLTYKVYNFFKQLL